MLTAKSIGSWPVQRYAETETRGSMRDAIVASGHHRTPAISVQVDDSHAGPYNITCVASCSRQLQSTVQRLVS